MGPHGGAAALSVAGGLATIRLEREHGNAINGELVRSLKDAFSRAAADGSVRGVLLAAAGKVFCPGLDLQDLSRLDRPAMKAFMAEFLAGVIEMFRFPKPVVAAIHGPAIAGGSILTLTADHRVLRRGAQVGLNEVRVGVPIPYPITVLLRHAVARERLAEVALLGRNLTDREAVEAGLAHEVLDADSFETHCLERLEEWASRDAAAFAATKTWLREGAVADMLGSSDAHLEAWLDAWFSTGTRDKIRRIVEQLREKGR